MKQLFLLVLLLIGVQVFGQNPTNYLYRASRERTISQMVDSMFRIPRYSGAPLGLRGTEVAIDGAIAMDTTNARLYIYNNGSWERLAKYSELPSSNSFTFGTSNGDTVHKLIINYASQRNLIIGPQIIRGSASYISDSAFYNAINAVDTLTASNILKKTIPRSNVGIQRVTYFNNGSTPIQFEEAGALYASRDLILDNADSVIAEASTSDYNWTTVNRLGIYNTATSHRSVIRSGAETGSVSWDATPINLNTLVFNTTAGNSTRLRGWWAGNTSYLYGNAARDTIDNWVGFYVTDYTYAGPQVKKYYSFASNLYNHFGASPHIDSAWFLYERDAGQVGVPINSYSYINGKLSIGGNVTGPTERLQVQGNALVTDTLKAAGKLKFSGLSAGAGTKALRIDGSGMISYADTTTASGTVTSVATNTGSGITGGTITTSGTIAADTTILATRKWRQKGIDSVSSLITAKLNISDTASMLSPYLRSSVASATYVPQTRTITINGTGLDLSANRSWSVGTVTSVATNTGSGITGGAITTSGTIAADTTSVLSTKANVLSQLNGYVPTSRTISNGYSITGGGNLTANRTLAVDSATLFLTGLRRNDSLTSSNSIGYVTKKILSDTAAAIRSAIGSGGGSTSPAGNYGNLQLNRNGAFATPGSDSLSYSNADGLLVKNKIYWGTNTTYIYGSSSSNIDIGFSGVKRVIFDLGNNAVRVARDGMYTFSGTSANPIATTMIALKIDSTDRLGITNESAYRDLKLRSIFGTEAASFNITNSPSGDFTIKGQTNNNLFFADASADAVGIGSATPSSLLSVGASNQFQVNSSGNIVKLNNVTTSFPSSNASGVLTNDGSGNLSWAAASGGGLTVGTTSITSGTSGRILYNNAGTLGELATTGSGSVVLATSPTLTTPTLGAATATTINGNTLTTGSYTLTGASAKTLTFNNTLTLAGTDATTMTFPSSNATIARTDAAQTFTGTQTFSQVITTNNAITATTNAATVPVTSALSTVTNNSAATLTITLTTSGAVDGQRVTVRVLDASAVAQTISWVNTENSSIAVPTTSNGSTTSFLTVVFIYNSATSKWRCIGYA